MGLNKIANFAIIRADGVKQLFVFIVLIVQEFGLVIMTPFSSYPAKIKRLHQLATIQSISIRHSLSI